MTSRRDPVPAARLRADRDAPLTVVDCTAGPPVPYATGWAWQRELVARRRTGEVGDTVLLLEHPSTYTLGRQADRANVLLSDAELDARGIELVEVDRGGDVTHHGPGQLVGYPVVALDGPRVVDHVRALEQLNIAVLAEHGLQAGTIEGYTGVWVDSTKVTAIGVRVTGRWVTQHGWATNVHTSMHDFAGIVACGITDPDKSVGSLATLGVDTSVAAVAAVTIARLAAQYETSVEVVSPEDVGLAVPA